MVITNRMKFAVVGAVVAATCALGALPGMAFAATNVDVHYTNAAGVAKTATIDLETLPVDTTTYGYMFQKNGVNNVIKADQTVTLRAVVDAAKTQQGDTADTTVWASGKQMTFTTDNGQAYTKYTDFSFTRLMAANYFWGETLSTGLPLGAASNAPAVLALSSGAQAMDASDEFQTAAEVLDTVTTSASTSPRLLWGWSTSNVPADQLGGNRYPSNIDSITIS
ncbi:MAG: hypothetical protein VB027_04545 [Gordonibacter sp.]|nr:hypothetical protein [Gordonibacter sp.]